MEELGNDHNRRLFFGLQNGKIKHISEVINGLKCECICPACEERLVARNGGTIRIHHFAHYKGNECKYGFQTSIHLVAKEILEKCGKIKVPGISTYIDVGLEDVEYRDMSISKIHELSKEFYIAIDKVILERKLHNYIPDVLIFSRNKKLIVEIAVTHFVGRRKLDKIKESKISALEIDLSKIKNDFNRDELESLIIEDLSLKSWLYNQYEQDQIPIKRDELIKEVQKIKAQNLKEEKDKKRKEREIWYEAYYKKVIRRENSKKEVYRQVENCPLKKRVYNDQYYANVAVDCVNCEHSRGTRENEEFLICLYEYHMNKRNCDF